MPHPLCSPEHCGANLRHRTNGEGRVVLAQCLYHGTVVLPGYEQYVAQHNEGSGEERGERRDYVAYKRGERRDYISYRGCQVCKKQIGIIQGKGRIKRYCDECAVQVNKDNARERGRRIKWL